MVLCMMLTDLGAHSVIFTCTPYSSMVQIVVISSIRTVRPASGPVDCRSTAILSCPTIISCAKSTGHTLALRFLTFF
jgi:hypothetical protein